ncbi:unnamed protein product, partial [Urochloa humidicola]
QPRETGERATSEAASGDPAPAPAATGYFTKGGLLLWPIEGCFVILNENVCLLCRCFL